MKKNKKIFLGLATLGAVAAPLAAAVSCGGSGFEGRYEGPNDHVIKILTDYKEGKKQMKALEKQVNVFNNGQGKTDGYRVEIVRQYPLPPFLASTYQAADKNKMPNIAITYPDTLGLVTKYDMQLNLNSQAVAAKAKTATTPAVKAIAADTTTKIDLSALFSKGFIETNNQIGGLKPGGTYAIPITKSTDFAGVNELVMGYILKEGGFKASTGTTTLIDKYIAKWNGGILDATNNPNVTQKEIDAIKTNMPKITPAPTGTMKFDDTMFTDGSKLLDFVAEAGKVFNIKSNGKAYILGIDSATNFIYNALNSITQAIEDKFAFKKDHKTGWIKYQLKDQQVKASLKEIWDKMKAAIDAGTLFIAGTVDGNKEYGSNFLSANGMGMSIGSTAGYSYLFKKPEVKDKVDGTDSLNETEVDAIPAPITWKNGDKSILIQGPSMIGLHVNKDEDEETAKFIKWFLGTSTATSTPLKTFTNDAGYIAPTQNILSGTADASWDKGMKLAFSNLAAVSQSTTSNPVHGFDNPVDNTTGEMRNVIQDAVHLQYSQHKTNHGKLAVDIDGLYAEIDKNFKSGDFE